MYDPIPAEDETAPWQARLRAAWPAAVAGGLGLLILGFSAVRLALIPPADARLAALQSLAWWGLFGVLALLAGGLSWLQALRRQFQAEADLLVNTGAGRPLALRFSGTAQGAYQALMAELTETATALRTADMPATLQTVEELCRALGRTVALTHEELSGTATAMRVTSQQWQDATVQSEAQLTRLVEMLEGRAATVAQIAQLTGSQVQSGLKEIVSAQLQVRMAASQASEVFGQSGGRAEELSERLMAATNLLRAGGKVLQETVDSVRTRMIDATAALTQTDARLTTIIEHNNVRLSELADQAQTVLARGEQGQEALAALASASERISATAQKLELSEGNLSRAVATMLAQSDSFAPVTERLRDLHQQLAQESDRSAADEQARRLETVADRLAGLADEIAAGAANSNNREPLPTIMDAPLPPSLTNALDQLARLGQLTETLSGLMTQLQSQQQAPSVAAAPDYSTEDPAGLRIAASLQLAQGQVRELLQKLVDDQSRMAEQVGLVQRICEQLRGQRFDRASLDETLQALGDQIARGHDQFTGELTGFLGRLEAALATPLPGESDAETQSEVTPLARAILAKLRGTDAIGEVATPATSLADALNRMVQIKRLTGALSQQAQMVLTVAGEPGDAARLADQARTLIDEVMGAISELSATAATLTETMGRLDQAG